DTGIIEISHDTLTRDQTSEYATGDAVTIARLSSFSKRLSFMLDSVSTDDWLNVYSRLFTSAISFYGDILQNEADSDVDYKSKGILYKEANDVSLPQESVPTLCNSSMFNADYPAENIDVLDSIIQLCKSYNIRVIVVVVPVSDASIWRRCGLDDFYIWLSAFCSKMGCEMYDMNLAKDRYSLYHDDISFYDETHMSMAGAKAFTKALCDIVNKSRTGEDISPLFYKSYNEMKQDSPYMQYLTS
ncbi:MAG: hypothetical protein IKM59_00865, partial [Oscillospiraceae bacterium]|nr:hypothetical protein [Oscillospiraceae bacterium]